jgi:hypothetical protein
VHNVKAGQPFSRVNLMMRHVVIATITIVTLAGAAAVSAQGRYGGRSRNDVARAQGVPPGQLPPAHLCRVWYSDRAPGRQPSVTSCQTAELIASRDRRARVVYGEDAYNARYGYGSDPYYDRYPDTDRGVYRSGRDRDPRISGGTYDPYYRDRSNSSPAYQRGYRDGLEKGRDDGDDHDRYDPNRHSWYRSADRGYDDDYGRKEDYRVVYRQGFEAGYAEGYRVYSRR